MLNEISSDKKTILCVDDDKNHLETIKQMILELGCAALGAMDYYEAIEILNTNKNISILLTDYNMEPKSGLELCRYVNEHYPEMRKIIITSMCNLPMLKNEEAQPFDAIVMKITELQNQIHNFI